jgi:hypothetical protein
MPDQAVTKEGNGYLNTSTYNTSMVNLITEMATQWLMGDYGILWTKL